MDCRNRVMRQNSESRAYRVAPFPPSSSGLFSAVYRRQESHGTKLSFCLRGAHAPHMMKTSIVVLRCPQCCLVYSKFRCLSTSRRHRGRRKCFRLWQRVTLSNRMRKLWGNLKYIFTFLLATRIAILDLVAIKRLLPPCVFTSNLVDKLPSNSL